MINKTKVLVVDDDEDIRDLLKLFLETAGYRVDLARDGLAALERLRNGFRPNLIILDLMMPNLDGEQFLNTIRADQYSDVPVVVMSGQTAATQKARELRVASCLAKPVEIKELLNTVRRLTKAGAESAV